MAEQEEFCAWCGKRRPLSRLFPLVSAHEETRQYHCRRELPCYARKIWKTRSILSLFRDDD
jgi:hypothetical protein